MGVVLWEHINYNIEIRLCQAADMAYHIGVGREALLPSVKGVPKYIGFAISPINANMVGVAFAVFSCFIPNPYDIAFAELAGSEHIILCWERISFQIVSFVEA